MLNGVTDFPLMRNSVTYAEFQFDTTEFAASSVWLLVWLLVDWVIKPASEPVSVWTNPVSVSSAKNKLTRV